MDVKVTRKPREECGVTRKRATVKGYKPRNREETLGRGTDRMGKAKHMQGTEGEEVEGRDDRPIGQEVGRKAGCRGYRSYTREVKKRDSENHRGLHAWRGSYKGRTTI